MRTRLFKLALAAMALAGFGSAAVADDYTVDPMHSGLTFQISHLGLTYVHGRFDGFSGQFTIDSSDPTKSSFSMNIKTESVDTNNPQRDGHLRSPDFFNAKQFPAITFASTSVKPVQGGYEVTGDLTLHGETKPITFTLKGGKAAEFPAGIARTGFVSTFTVKRSEFGVGDPKFAGMLGDDVYVSVGFEGTKKK